MNDLIDKLLAWRGSGKSGDQAKKRLKLILAHDRADLSPEILDMMRQEILEVVGRYLDIDTEETELLLESDQRTTALIANFPIRRIKRRPLT
ncbi:MULTISPECIES: cell division topological specificity factor MinE [Microcystis]|jgi:cell division topological specificity factor|nr:MULTISPECIES: cell division topological specificity factor MinE [Microcystis]MCZ8163068.1 cell division topological specificity factor MinE [Microcystis sp. LE19-196.1B]MCZ8274287.1 cell division topological specificity factor MinE [Microcystis sp. LE19-4.1E]MCZ8306030.1 cell division topological specificity factor MinE [Microcystis sp. LE19-98.1E]REJ56361.1 MAG: cell division topological specificity factor MinE [Microcystis aeruginosa DA14]GBE76548.1 septum site-determining protein MinE [M